MKAQITTDPLLLMVADTLRSSDAPRYLISLCQLGPGEYRIEIDHAEVSEADSADVWLLVSEGERGRRGRLSFPSTFRDENANGLPFQTVWHHYLVSDGMFREAKTMEETLPAQFDYEIDLSSLAASVSSVEDLCDACALPRDAELRGRPPADPLETAPPFDGRV